MIVLDLPTLTLEVVCGGAKTTTDPQWTATYRNLSKGGNETFSFTKGSTNGTTAQTAVSAPKPGDKHILSSLTIYNTDTVSTTVTIQIYDGSARVTLLKITLATLETLIYDEYSGWVAYTTAGARK